MVRIYHWNRRLWWRWNFWRKQKTKKRLIVTYDYIIAGSGCAGLSLLYRMLKDPVLNGKKILVLDQAAKNNNDRTWCYWEKGTGLFEEIVTHQWKSLEFKTSDFTKKFDLQEYAYKMIQGIDFYEFILSFSKEFKNVTFEYQSILEIETEGDFAIVKTDGNLYKAKYVFNSTGIFNPEINVKNSLLQHFQGWVIESEKSVFNPGVGTLMDFSLSQKNGATFMYVLPTSSTEALIEYTLFSEKVLKKEEYEIELRNYIQDVLKIENYKIKHTEYGVIPMSLAKFSRNPNSQKRIINLGTAGGFTKASSGYTFQFIQKNTAEIVCKLNEGKDPNSALTMRDKRFEWYDRTLLEVMISKKVEGKVIFETMFKKLSPELILKFLGNETSLIEDIQIIKSLPIKPFLIAGMKQMGK